ncbi:MAG: hypothetical protein ABL876_03830 [Chitinophagaceae bacterium]
MIKPITFLLLLSLAACNNSGNNNNISKSPATDTTPPPPVSVIQLQSDTLQNWLGAYYKLDDKYSQQQDTSLINNWWRNKLLQVQLYVRPANLFSHKGGGLNGAEWNAATDLFIAGTTSFPLKNETLQVYLNNKPASGIKLIRVAPSGRTGSLLFFRLPQGVWEKELRDIQTADLEALYGKDSLRKPSPAPLQTGKLLEIAIHIIRGRNETVVLKGFFHVAYGE